MTYVDRMHKSLVGRSGDWLARNRYPYVTMLVAYLVAAFVAYRSYVSFRFAGLQNHVVLFALSFLAAYLCFAISLSVWLCTIPMVDKAMLLDGAGREIETACPSDFVMESNGESGSGSQSSSFESTGEGSVDGAHDLAGLLLGLLIMGLILSMVLSLYYSRWCLGSLMVNTGKVEHHVSAGASQDAWLLEPFRQTLWPAMGLLFHVMLLGSLASQLPLLSSSLVGG